MFSLFQVLRDAFIITSRNFTLVYIFLFLFVALQPVFFQLVNAPPSPKFFGVAFLGLLLVAAIMSGWFAMVGQACISFLQRRPDTSDKNADKTVELFSPFKLFGAFFPGIGSFFVQVSLGYILQAAWVLLLCQLIQPYWQKNAVVLNRLLASAKPIQPDMIYHLPLAQQQSLNEFSLFLLASLGVTLVLMLLTQLWPVFLVLYGKNIFTAFGASIRQFFKDPLNLLLIFGLSVVIQFSFMLVTISVVGQGNLFILNATLQLVGFLLKVFFTVLLFLYALRKIGEPSGDFFIEPAADQQEPPSSSSSL